MSLRIIKEGILDTIQDSGRHGLQHLGINPGGAMDRFSAQLANALLGKEPGEPVLELHFPAAHILFEKPAIISITGADFKPLINNQQVPMHHPIAVHENSMLQFSHMENGSRAYISILQSLEIPSWKNSYSTHLRAGLGGFEGRALKRYDVIPYETNISIYSLLKNKEFMVLPWKAVETVEDRSRIQCLIGSEWHSLDQDSKIEFEKHWFQVSKDSDRMGYRLMGPSLNLKQEEPQVSTGVSFGTVQLLPDGQVIVLMADHQTAGGYPKIAHVISAHLPLLAQKKPGDAFHFELTDLTTAEEKLVKQQKYLGEIRLACKFRMENVLHES